MTEEIRRRKAARRRAGQGGFSMIELMVVIVILGMLATLVAVNVLGNLEEANVQAARAQISTFKTALMSYRLTFKKFPEGSKGLDALINNPKGKKFLEGTTSVPKDPWGNDYLYSSPGPNGEPYEIKSLGADGQPGGTGENADIVSWNLQGES
jgi:general secretion pathway protein G